MPKGGVLLVSMSVFIILTASDRVLVGIPGKNSLRVLIVPEFQKQKPTLSLVFSFQTRIAEVTLHMVASANG